MRQSQTMDMNNKEVNQSKIMNSNLMVELEKIERQKALKKKMEEFILRFNKDYDAGILYMIESNMVISFKY